MKKYLLLLPVLALMGCAEAGSPSPTPGTPVSTGMANPASVYCQQKGGVSVPVQTPQGVRSDCKLPGGEIIDEWDLFRRDHPQPAG